MPTPEDNIATLTKLYLNLGPGIDHFMAHAREAMTEDVLWLNLGFPTVNGLDELERMLHMLKDSMRFDSNPILEWRNLWGHENRVFFERHSCFKDVDGEIIVEWDVLGVYEFDDHGKIYSARDYYDNAENYPILAASAGEAGLAAIKALSVHPLAEDFDPAARPYDTMAKQASSR